MTSKIRKACLEDAQDCAKLIYISGPHLFSYFLFKHDPEIFEVLETLCKMDGTTFSHDNIIVEEENNKIRGMILGFPVSCAGSLETRLWKYIIRNQGILYFFKYLFRAMGLLCLSPSLTMDEFFISNLAVFEEYRGMGIAVKLLDSIEKSVLEKGMKKLSLYVEIDNIHAKSIYEKYGFKEVGRSAFPAKYQKFNLLGFHKMVKIVG